MSSVLAGTGSNPNRLPPAAGAGDEGRGAECHPTAEQSPPRESPFRQTVEIGLFGLHEAAFFDRAR